MFQLHYNFFLKNNPEKLVSLSCSISKWKIIKNSSTSDFSFFNFLPKQQSELSSSF